jgi:hypothetical protein
MVSFDVLPVPIVLEVSSNSLRVEHVAAALPPYVPIPSFTNIPMHLKEKTKLMIVKSVQDQEEEEHLLEFMAQIEDAEEGEFGEAKKMEQNLPILRT